MFENARKMIARQLLKTNGGLLNPFQVISNQTADVAVYGDMTVRKATREGYKISIYVYRAIRTIIQAGSGIPWVVLDSNGEIIENHQLTNVLRKPNKEFSGQDLMEFLIAHLLLCGNALWQPLIVDNKVKEIWTVMPDLVKPIPANAPGEWLKGWQVTSMDGSHHEVPSEQFVHFMQMDPGNPYWGIGPLMAAARTIDTDNEAQDTQKISMQNRLTPDGMFSHEAVLNQPQLDEATRRIREYYLAKGKRREPWVLGGGVKWTQLSMTPVEMDFIKSRLSNKQDIAAAFGLDPWWLGDRSASTYNNILEARKALYIEVVIPMLDDIKSTLNLKLAPMYGDITITYDTSRVAALREDYNKKVEQAKTLWAMGVPFDKINARLEMGFDEFEGWENGYLPFSLAPVGSTPPEEEPKSFKEFVNKMPITLDEAIPWLKEMRDRVSDKWINDAMSAMTKALNLETEEQKTYHWKRIDQRRVAWWSVVGKKVEPLYKDEGRAVAKAIEGKNPKDLIRLAGKAIKDGEGDWEKIITAISTALVEDFGNEIAEDLGGEKADHPTEVKWTFDPMSAAARAWIIKHGAESVTTILATNLDDVKRVILAGVDDNVGTAKIARNLRQFYSDRSSFKAMRVARTETSHASGFGQREAARQSGVVKTKSWISSRDDRVRDAHIAMDSKANHNVPLNKAYSDGSMYPGEQDIMCRCVESYQTGG